MKSENTFVQALVGAGYRLTKQRQAVCTYLAQTDQHPTPYDAFAEISRTHPDVSRATVYNTLNLLKQLGAITEISFGDDHTHYETDISPHINLICLRCHSVTDYKQEIPLDTLHEEIGAATGFYPVASKAEIFGFCQDCRDKRREEILDQWRSQQISAPGAAEPSENEEKGEENGCSDL